MDVGRRVAKGVFATADLLLPAMPGPRLLIYHELTPEPVKQMDLAPGVFERQMEWLAGHGRIVTLDEAIKLREDPESRKDFVLTFDDGYAGLAEFGFSVLRRLGMSFTLYVTSGLIGSAPNYLTWDQIAEMMSSGLVTIGAHTHSHPDLRTIAPPEIERELDISNEMIEGRLGVRPRHFAYPKGYWSEAAEPLLRERYETSVLGAGPPITGNVDLQRLSRVPVQRADGLFFFKRKVTGGMRAEEWARSRLKRYRNPHADDGSGVG